MAAERVFTYGTLRRGEPAAALMADASLLATAVTEPHFTLFDLGAYPAVVAGGQTAIVGELYAVSPAMLRLLDDFERVPDLYCRERTRIGQHWAWIYLMPEAPAGARVIAGGDWCRRAADGAGR